MDGREKLLQQEATKLELSNNTEFRWAEEPKWQGMNQNGVTKLYSEVGATLDIKPDEAKKIKAYFGDNISVFWDDKFQKNTACCIADFDDKGTLEKCTLVFNRSLKVAMQGTMTNENGYDQKEGIACIFQDPKECLIWNFAEELGHARIFIKADTKEREVKWQQNYTKILANNGVRPQDGYRSSLQEVTVSRNAVKVLKKMFPERTDYYQDLIDRSLEEHKQIVPNVTNVIEEAYIKTGFDPENVG